jgi:RND superfamily putative drug exporter
MTPGTAGPVAVFVGRNKYLPRAGKGGTRKRNKDHSPSLTNRCPARKLDCRLPPLNSTIPLLVRIDFRTNVRIFQVLATRATVSDNLKVTENRRAPERSSVFLTFGRFIYRHRWPVVLTWLIVGLASLPLAPTLPRYLKAGGYADDTLESQRAGELLASALGWKASSLIVIFHSDSLTTDDPRFFEAADAAIGFLRTTPGVGKIETFQANPQQIAANHRTAYDTVELDALPEDAHLLLPNIRERLHSDVLQVDLTGSAAFYADVETVSESDLQRAEILTFPIAILGLTLVFGSIVAAAGPVIIGGVAVIVALAILSLVGRVTDLSIFVLNLVTMLGLGLGTDYSLFIVSRFREELPKMGEEDAIALTLATAGRTVVFSGIAVFVGLLGLLTFHFMILRSLGLAGALVVALAVAAALTLLPALLGILGPRVNALPVGPGWQSRNQIWERLAVWVLSRSGKILVPVLGLLVGMGIPFLFVHFSLPDARVLPPTVSSRRGADLFQREFGESDLAGIIIAVQVDGSIFTPERIHSLSTLVRSLQADPRVRSVHSIVSLDPRFTEEQYQLMYSAPGGTTDRFADAVVNRLAHGSVTAVVITTRAPAIDPETEDLVLAIRGYQPGAGLHLLVDGGGGAEVDIVGSLYRQFPRTLLLIVVLSYVILFILFQSVILPLKAILMDTLSLLASYGSLVVIFQGGLFSGLLGFQPLGFVDATLPIIMFCLLFGLSMDYEVFLLSRMKEVYDATGDNDQSIVAGLARSGQVITSAAMIVVVVSLSFVTADIVLIKALGLGTAIAVLLDATIVRGLLVPAVMRLLGDANWWAPRFARRPWVRHGPRDIEPVPPDVRS